MSITLPKPIADYVSANARLDIEAMLMPFALDAIVVDNGKRFEGRAEIRNLLEKEVIAAKAVFTPETIRHENDKIVVEGPTHGNFPGSPIHFTYAFLLENGAITALDITL